MKRFLCDTTGAVSIDWVVILAATIGLGVAVLSTISTGSLDLADKTAAALAGPQAPDDVTVVSDEGTNFFPWIDTVETDDAGTWTYNAQNQLIDPEDGSLLPITASVAQDGGFTAYYNQRGEAVDEQGVRQN